MAEKRWYKPVFFTLVILGVVLLATGASLTEPGMDELAYGTSGSFEVEASHVDASIIVLTDNNEENCETFELTVDRHDGSNDFVPVEKTNCDRWSLPNSYQFSLGNLSEGKYGFYASDSISIVAVKGDLDAYMEDYASGNAIADLGSSMCCLSMLLYVFIGRGIAKANNTEDQIVAKQTYIDDSNQPAFPQAVQTVESVPVETEDASIYEAVMEEVQEVMADASLEEALEEKASSGGAFWDNITED